MNGVAEGAFRRHYQHVYGFFRRRVRDPHRAEELTQDVFAAAAAGLPKPKEGDPPVLAWLYTVARRRFVDESRRLSRERRPKDLPARTTSDYGPFVARALREALGELPGGHSQVVVLKLLRGTDLCGDRSRGRPHRGRGQDAFQARARDAARRADREGDRAMTIRDREVLEELRDDPELLALADAVVETQRLRRRTPIGALTAVAVAAAALFALVLASPWDRGGGERASVLDRALAAIETRGRVVHMTIRFEEAGGRRFSPVITESFYDGQTGLVRVISRSDGKTLADYTTKASEDEFVMFPGLLEGADYYREALSSGRAKVVGSGVWRGRPVHWVRLEGRGGPGSPRSGSLARVLSRSCSEPSIPTVRRPASRRP